MQNKTEVIDKLLVECGLTPRLMVSKKEQIDPRLYEVLPTDKLRGFGMMGSAGVGKSCAIAWWLRHINEIRYDYLVGQADGRELAVFNQTGDFRSKRFDWIYWPDCALAHQDANRFGEPIHALRRGDSIRPHPFAVQTLKSSPLLVLDDLGRERGNIDSYTNQILDSVINYRYEHNLPTIWTTNLEQEAFIAQYGMPMLDRLTGMSPAAGWVQGDSKRGTE